MSVEWKNNKELQIFLEYLRIPSVHPNVNYDSCVEFLRRQAASLDLPVTIYTPGGPTKPIVVMKWEGMEPTLPTIVLNSHMDVVPVFEDKWTHPPFAAVIDKEGRIFGRGTQDMKCVGIWYLSAIRALKKDGFKPKRTVYVMFVPDEEIGGSMGMEKFVQTNEFRTLNIGLSMDEGMASPNDVMPIYYAERSTWRMRFKCNGTAGHGSLLLENTAGEKAYYLMTKLMNFRQQEKNRFKKNPKLNVGDVTTVNLTMMSGGKQGNVVPPYVTITFDVRLAIDVVFDEFENNVMQWCEEAGGNIEIYYERKEPLIKPTSINDSNPFWIALRSVLQDELQLKIETRVFPGGTDSRLIRDVGIPAFGFSPIDNTPLLLHDNDEFIRVDTFLKGIEIYKKIIPKLANV